jgi:hypothetical protein
MASDNKPKTQKISLKKILWKKGLATVFLCLGLFSFLLTVDAGAADLNIENPNWASINDIQIDFGGPPEICSSLNCGPYNIPDGTAVTLWATPGLGYVFTDWTGAVSDSSNPVTFTKSAAPETVTGNFAKQNFTLTTSQVGNGAVTPSTTYVFDQNLPVSAVPDTGWQFDFWIGDTANLVDPNAASTNLINPIYNDTTLQANFSKINYILTIGSTIGNGTVTPPTGTTYVYDDSLPVQATPDPGWKFDSWIVTKGGLVDTSAASTNLINPLYSDSDIKARFKKIDYTLTISVAAGNGSVLPATGTTYNYDSALVVSAIPDTGWEFVEWTGPDVANLEDPNSATTTLINPILSDTDITANFQKKVVFLTMQKVGNGSGDVTPSTETPGPTYAYDWGDVVTVTATPNPVTSEFAGWSANVSSGTVEMIGDQTVTATFMLKSFTVSFSAGPDGTLQDIGGNLSDTFTQTVFYGQNAEQVLAVPDEFHHFTEWTGDVTGTEPELAVNNVTVNISVTANFQIDTYMVTYRSGAFGSLEDHEGNLYDEEYIQMVPHGSDALPVTAVPDDQNQFTGWTGDFTSDQLTLIIPAVTQDMVVTFETIPDINGCAGTVVTNYSSGFNSAHFDLINIDVDSSGNLTLQTGNQSIDPETVIVPFTQDVYVTFLYEGAGYVSDFGWMLYEDAVDSNGDFLGWNNIPNSKKHPIYHNIRDDAETAGCCGGGDGVLDTDYGNGGFPTTNEASMAVYNDGTGIPFHIDQDGTVTPRDMKKFLGKFQGGTEIVFWLTANRDWDTTDEDMVFFNKPWNPDSYDECEPPSGSSYWIDESNGIFNKVYDLGTPLTTESGCQIDKPWLAEPIFNRMDTYFNVQLSGDYNLRIEVDEHYPHVIVGAPPDDPNQWILGFEDLNADSGGSDMDHNDMVFHIERKTGGTAQLISNQAIVPAEANAYFTAVTFEVYDHIPGGSCLGQTSITYYVSIDDGQNWVEITAWDAINSYTLEEDGSKTLGDSVNPETWVQGQPPYTYRSRRIDFAGRGLSGDKLIWKAELVSHQEDCAPQIVDVMLTGDVATHGIFSRSSPIVQTNVLYAGSYETPAVSWNEKVNRGHLTATRLYTSTDPNQTATGDQTLWDAGEVLTAMNPDNRTIYFPNITLSQVTAEHLTDSGGNLLYGDGTTKTFSGTLANHPVSATTLRIFDTRPETFSDEHTDDLKGSLGGTGTIKRFTGEWTVTFNTAPELGVPIKASYSYYSTSSTLRAFNTTNVTNSMLALTDEFIWPDGYVYDFDGDGSFNESDGDWLVDWVRGFRQPNSNTKKEWLLGPIDHSIPALLTPPGTPEWYFGSAVTESERLSYDAFKNSHQERDTVLFVGSRDGKIHAFEAGKFRYGDNPKTTGIKELRGYFLWEDLSANDPGYCNDVTDCPNYGTGKELWAFIPADLIPRLKNNVLKGDDQAYVDASPALADVYIDTNNDGVNDNWRTVMLSAEGNGGDTVFCLDVTNPLNPRFMWEFAAPELFRSRSSPAVGQIGRIQDPITNEAKWVAFFVTGKVEDANLFPAIYIIDISNGSVLDRVVLDDAVDMNSDGLIDAAETDFGRGGVPSGQPAIVDTDDNGFIDRLYVASDRGFMYKVNIPDDPEIPIYAITHCILNTDFIDEDGNEIAASQRWHPIYASPAVVVNNGVTDTGEIDYNILVLFGTGDSPFYDENINTDDTRYHFFAYLDKAGKGVCNANNHILDWSIELESGHRIFASAFAAAGLIYFGTSTAETEDPCQGNAAVDGNEGMIYAVDLEGTVILKRVVGDITSSPLVEDEHLYFRTPTGLVSLGSGIYNNEIQAGGTPRANIKSWQQLD